MARAPAKGRTASREAQPAAPRANKDRGEHLLELAGVTYKLRPSYDAIVEMEEATGLSLVDLTRKADRHGLSLPETAKVAAALIRAGADDPLTRMVSADVLGGQIYEQGVISVVIRLTLCLSDAVGGGRTASGEVKAAAA
jgi:hypothetical protein